MKVLIVLLLMTTGCASFSHSDSSVGRLFKGMGKGLQSDQNYTCTKLGNQVTCRN